MTTSKETVAFILDQMAPLPVRSRAMFGEYGLYCDEKIVGLICDDTLFVKPTAIAGAFADDAWLAPPYPGAKDSFAIPGDRLDDREWLQAFIQQTADALPVPKPKKPRKAKKAGA
jgi:TfoX/Sxy family transcriptional regulator of competence genes